MPPETLPEGHHSTHRNFDTRASSRVKRLAALGSGSQVANRACTRKSGSPPFGAKSDLTAGGPKLPGRWGRREERERRGVKSSKNSLGASRTLPSSNRAPAARGFALHRSRFRPLLTQKGPKRLGSPGLSRIADLGSDHGLSRQTHAAAFGGAAPLALVSSRCSPS